VITASDRPMLKPWLSRTVAEDRLVVSAGAAITVFEGAASVALLPPLMAMLDGSLTVDEIVTTLGESIRPAIEQAIAELSANSLLVTDDEFDADGTVIDPALVPSAATAIAADRLDSAPAHVAQKLQAGAVTVIGQGSLAGEIVRLLRIFGVGDVQLLPEPPANPDDSLHVMVVNPGADGAATEWNARAIEEDRAWLPVMAYDGRLASVGPLITPGKTACFECLRIRRASNLSFRAEQRQVDAARDASATASVGGVVGGPMAHMTATVTADAAMGMLLAGDGEPSMLAGRVTTIAPSMDGTQLETHRLYRVPRCPACSRTDGLGHPQVWFEQEISEDQYTEQEVDNGCATCGG
jgi:bacteriocin biosynthesis cyclodehydratase domain-containing protein